MREVADFFASMTGLTESLYVEYFDQLLALYYALGTGFDCSLTVINSKPLQFKLTIVNEEDRAVIKRYSKLDDFMFNYDDGLDIVTVLK